MWEKLCFINSFHYWSVILTSGNVEEIRLQKLIWIQIHIFHADRDPQPCVFYDIIHWRVLYTASVLNITGEYCTQHQFWTSLVGLRVVAILVFAPHPHAAPFITFPSYGRRWTWPIFIGVQFPRKQCCTLSIFSCIKSTFCDQDLDPYESTLVWLPGIRIRFRIEIKSWIRIRIGDQCGSTTLLESVENFPKHILFSWSVGDSSWKISNDVSPALAPGGSTSSLPGIKLLSYSLPRPPCRVLFSKELSIGLIWSYRYPKFIWAPCAQLYSLSETLQPTPA